MQTETITLVLFLKENNYSGKKKLIYLFVLKSRPGGFYSKTTVHLFTIRFYKYNYQHFTALRVLNIDYAMYLCIQRIININIGSIGTFFGHTILKIQQLIL